MAKRYGDRMGKKFAVRSSTVTVFIYLFSGIAKLTLSMRCLS